MAGNTAVSDSFSCLFFAYMSANTGREGIGSKRRDPHLMPCPPTPLHHLWDSILIHLPAGLADGVDDGEVALKGVEGVDSCL